MYRPSEAVAAMVSAVAAVTIQKRKVERCTVKPPWPGHG